MYAVFSISNLCPDGRKCRLFDDEASAGQFLQEDWEDCLNMLIARQNSLCGQEASCHASLDLDEIDYEQTYHEDDYAVISDTKGSRIEWFVVETE